MLGAKWVWLCSFVSIRFHEVLQVGFVFRTITCGVSEGQSVENYRKALICNRNRSHREMLKKEGVRVNHLSRQDL